MAEQPGTSVPRYHPKSESGSTPSISPPSRSTAGGSISEIEHASRSVASMQAVLLAP
jgi:hypothetical protein